MRKWIISAVLGAAIVGVLPSISGAQTPAGGGAVAAAADKAAAEVPVKTVVLFSSGVGYFQHVGKVTGTTSSELFFKTNQINDVLKSLVLEDKSGGKVTSVVIPSQDPVNRLLRSFQINLTENPSMAELLNQLRGAKVKVSAGAENLAGTILGMEQKQKAVEKTPITVWVLNMVAGGTIRSIAMDDISKIELEDPQLQQELTKALAALATSRDQEKKPVSIQFQGTGERQVLVGYVVETPIWKTSYRLLLKDGGKTTLQGWAIIENQTDNDWNDVSLSLVSGRPISFIQELYSPLYIPRPTVQPELYASLRPQTYDAGMQDKIMEALAPVPANRPNTAVATGGGMGGGMGGMGGGAGGGGRGGTGRAMASSPATVSDSLGEISYMSKSTSALDASTSVASIANASQIGELFQYTVGNVTLPRQRSAMIPIINDAIEIEKLSIYNANVQSKYPLNGVQLKNTTKNHLLQGPVTVIDGAYAGDARINDVPPGQSRLLSYGVDLQVLVNSTKNKTETSIFSVKIVKGVMTIQRKNVFTQEYAIDNKSDAEKTIMIEHPLRNNWKLTEPKEALETTETLYRFKTKVGAGKAGTFTVSQEYIPSETIQLLSVNPNTMEFYTTNKEMPQKVKDALTKAIKLRQTVSETQKSIDQARSQLSSLSQDQARIRDNLKAVPDKSTQQQDYLQKLAADEKKIEENTTKVENLTKDLTDAQKALDDYLNGLNID